MDDKYITSIYRSIYPNPFLNIDKMCKTKKTKEQNNIIYIDNKKDRYLYDVTDYFIFYARIKCNYLDNLSPYKVYEQKILNRTMTDADIRNIYKMPACTLLPFNRIILILKELLPDCDDIKYIDCSAGWGDRLIAAFLYGVTEYVAYDPNKLLKKGHDDIIKYFEVNDNLFSYFNPTKKNTKRNYKINYKGFETEYKKKYINYFDICISSPPFFIKEIYSLDKTQSHIKYNTISKWLNDFLYNSFLKIIDYLKPGGYLCWYIEDSENINYVNKFLFKTSKLKSIQYINYIGFTFDNINIRKFYIWKKL